MGQFAPRVVVDADGAQRLRDLVFQLPGNARVQVFCEDGSSCSGVVYVRPSTQAFRDKAGAEGINGVLRLGSPGISGEECHVWLDQIKRVHRLDGIDARFET